MTVGISPRHNRARIVSISEALHTENHAQSSLANQSHGGERAVFVRSDEFGVEGMMIELLGEKIIDCVTMAWPCRTAFSRRGVRAFLSGSQPVRKPATGVSSMDSEQIILERTRAAPVGDQLSFSIQFGARPAV